MSIIQDNLNELRYIKRANLHEEAKIIGNYYRDIIRSYGVDCNYYKLKSNYPTEFLIELDHTAKSALSGLSGLSSRIGHENFQDHNMQMHAYGIEPDPDFSISSKLITYMEVESDIFNLNKYGIIPNTDVNFYFDSNDFAASFSPKTGRLREYKFKEKTLSVEGTYKDLLDLSMHTKTENDKYFLSSDFFIPLIFYSEELAAPVSAIVPLGKFPLYSTDNKYALSGRYCDISGETNARILFPVNEVLYKSFNYEISGPVPPKNIALYAELSLIVDGKYQNLTNIHKLVVAMAETNVISSENQVHNVSEIVDATVSAFNPYFGITKKDFITVRDIIEFYKLLRDFKLIVKFSGSLLFTDLNLMAKYKEKIVPMVGDIVTIDFPDENNRERYQITECNDKDLSQSGLNPLLHKYIWKCKAKRYVNDHEIFPEHNNADEHFAEKLDFTNTAAAAEAEEIDIYPVKEDKVYGGYEKKEQFKDINEYSSQSVSEGNITLFEFRNGSKLKTDGYELYFYTKNNEEIQLDKYKNELKPVDKYDSEVQFIKASRTHLIFVDLEGTVGTLAAVDENDFNPRILSLTSMTKLTKAANGAINPNSDGNDFYKFSNSGTILFSDGENLFCYFLDQTGNNYIECNLTKNTEEDL